MSTSVLGRECLNRIAALQNGDGGWGFHEASRSRVEPTCWAYLALQNNEVGEADRLTRARDFLLDSQHSEGFWSASPEMSTGSWVTSLACLTLLNDPEAEPHLRRAFVWLCGDYPLSSSPLIRLVRKLRLTQKYHSMNEELYGWGWTPRTASWVEPTAFGIIALENGSPKLVPAVAKSRRETAVAMLYDRMCPGGGWNCGNPSVYGVPGEPLVLPTAWALLALRSGNDHPNRADSLEWLQRTVATIQSAGSLAVAILCLETYGVPVPAARAMMEKLTASVIERDGVHVLSWVSLVTHESKGLLRLVGATK